MAVSPFKNVWRYRSLRDAERNEEAEDAEAHVETFSTTRNFLSSLVVPWVFCAILSFLLFLQSAHVSTLRTSRFGTFEEGFKTELDIATSQIRLHNQRFYGAFRLDSNGTYYLTTSPDAKVYVGPPSAEIDASWHDLLYGRFSGLSKQEASTMGIEFIPDDYKRSRLYWEPSVTHNLHCINYLRKALDKEHYPDIDSSRKPEVPWESSHRMHLDHCIDILRQSIMCNVDMTPVPRTWVAPGDFWHADPDQLHTCRDFTALREWISERNRRFPEPNPTEND